MAVAVTSIDVGIDPLSVKISWTAPNDNNEVIIEYEILIRKSGGTEYAEETVTCDGVNAAIVSARQCFVPITTLRGSDYNLVYGDLVAVRARARNSLGFG